MIYEFSYDWLKQKYGAKKLGCNDTGSFIVYIKTEDIYLDVARDVETRFVTSS